MSEDVKDSGIVLPIWVGLFCTAAILFLFTMMAVKRRCELLSSHVLECRTNWEWFLDSRPNEIGDALAGFSASLAFVWIIVTVLLQTVELRAQREELKLTRKEFSEMSKSLERQANALDKDEIVHKEKRYHNLLNQKILDVIKDYSDLVAKCAWVGPGDAYGNGPSLILSSVESADSWKKGDRVLAEIFKLLKDLLSFNFDEPPWVSGFTPPSRPPELAKISNHIKEMQSLAAHLSIGNQERLLRMNLPGLLATLEALTKSEVHWAEVR